MPECCCGCRRVACILHARMRRHAICCLTQAHARQVKRRKRKEPQRLDYALATPKRVRDKTEPAQFKINFFKKTNASNFLKREVQDKNEAGGADAVAETPNKTQKLKIAVCKTCMKVFQSIHALYGHKTHCKKEIVEGTPNVEPKTEALGESSIVAAAGLLAMQAGAPKMGKVKSGKREVRLAKSVNGAMHKGARATHKFKISKSKILFKSSASKKEVRATHKCKSSKGKILFKSSKSKKKVLCPCNAYSEHKGQRVSRSVSHVISPCDRPIFPDKPDYPLMLFRAVLENPSSSYSSSCLPTCSTNGGGDELRVKYFSDTINELEVSVCKRCVRML